MSGSMLYLNIYIYVFNSKKFVANLYFERVDKTFICFRERGELIRVLNFALIRLGKVNLVVFEVADYESRSRILILKIADKLPNFLSFLGVTTHIAQNIAETSQKYFQSLIAMLTF